MRRMRGLKTILWAALLLLCQAVLGGDGLDHWHVRYSAPEGIYFGTVAAGQDRFVAVGRNGRIVTSTDALQWTLADSGTTVSLENVASGNGAFVATAVPNTVIRSTDGLTACGSRQDGKSQPPSSAVLISPMDSSCSWLQTRGARGQCFLFNFSSFEPFFIPKQ